MTEDWHVHQDCCNNSKSRVRQCLKRDYSDCLLCVDCLKWKLNQVQISTLKETLATYFTA